MSKRNDDKVWIRIFEETRAKSDKAPAYTGYVTFSDDTLDQLADLPKDRDGKIEARVALWWTRSRTGGKDYLNGSIETEVREDNRSSNRGKSRDEGRRGRRDDDDRRGGRDDEEDRGRSRSRRHDIDDDIPF